MVDVVLHRRGASAGQQIAVRRPPFVTGGGLMAAFLQGFQRTAVGFIHRRSTKASLKAECSRPVSDRRSVQIEAHRRKNWNIQVVNIQLRSIRAANRDLQTASHQFPTAVHDAYHNASI